MRRDNVCRPESFAKQAKAEEDADEGETFSPVMPSTSCSHLAYQAAAVNADVD